MTIRLDSDLGISASGNVTGNYIIGDGSQLTNISSSYGNANVAAYLANNTGNVSGGNVIAVGNVIAGGVKTDNYMYANGTPVTFEDGYGDSNVGTYLNGVFTGNIVPAGNNTQSLGNATNQWSDIWVSNATIYLNSIPLGVNANGVLQFDGNDLVTSGPNVVNTGNIDTSGDITGGNLIVTAGGGVTFGDGSVQTTAYGDANVEAYLPSSNTIISINSNVANTDSNVANLTLTVANLATAGSLANTNSNVANLSSDLANTNSNVANLSSDLANTNSEVGNLTITVADQGNAIANLQADAYSNSNVATFLDNFGSNSIFTTGDISAANVTVSDLYSPAFYGNAVMYTNATGHLTNINLFKYDPGSQVLTVGAVSTTGNIVANTTITASYLIGEGSNISNIQGANVTGAVALAGNATVAFSIDGANVVGEVAVANTVSNPSQPNITALGTITSLTADAVLVNGLLTANSNAQFNGDVYFAGNVTLPGNINQISGNSATFFGDPVTGFGALYAGLIAGYTPLVNEVVQFADNFNSYAQVTHQNINGGDQATTDYVATASNGTDTTNFVDLGIAGGGYNGTLANNSLGTSLFANDGYLYTQGNVTGGNLVLGSKQVGGVVRIIANGASNIGDVVATFGANGLTVGDITATSGSPAPSISGFSFSGLSANISGNVSGNYLLGNGSQITNLPAPAVAQDITSVGDMSIMTYDGNIKYVNNATVEPSTGNIKSAGNISAVGNVAGNFFIGNGSQLTGLDSSPAIVNINSAIANTNSNVANLTTSLGNTDSNVTTLQGQVYANANVFSYLGSNSNVAIVTNGNISGNFFIGDGSQLTNLPGGTGNITFVATTISAPNDDQINIQALDADGLVNSQLRLDPNNLLTRLQQWSNQRSQYFTTANWGTGTYTEQGIQGAVVFTNAVDIIAFVNSLTGVGQIYFSVNGGPQLVWDGSSADPTNITFFTPTLPETDPITVTTFELFYSYNSLIEIDYDSDQFNIESNNADLTLQSSGQGRIQIFSDNNLSLQGNGSVSISNLSNAGGIDIRTDSTSLSSPAWLYGVDGSLALATVNDESAKLVGTRRVIGGLSATAPYSVTLAAGGTPTVAYTSLPGTNSARVTFVTQSGGGGFQWEQFDVVAVPSQDVGGAVNYVVSNRVKSAAGIPDTVVSATMNSGQIEISLTLDAVQTSGGTASFDAVEFGLMVD